MSKSRLSKSRLSKSRQSKSRLKKYTKNFFIETHFLKNNFESCSLTHKKVETFVLFSIILVFSSLNLWSIESFKVRIVNFLCNLVIFCVRRYQAFNRYVSQETYDQINIDHFNSILPFKHQTCKTHVLL